MNILVTVDKFNQESKDALRAQCKDSGIISYNQLNRKLTTDELIVLLKETDPNIIIAGTEKYDDYILSLCPNLKVISRVGIGVDSIDFDACRRRNIIVKNTPDAPSNAVAELAIGQMFNTLRRIQVADKDIRDGRWIRYVGKDLSRCTVGIIGHGRIGKLVSNKLQSLTHKVLVCDIDPMQLTDTTGIVTDINTIIKDSDIISIHIPLSEKNKGLISKSNLDLMKKDAIIINTSRGGLIDEIDLYKWLSENKNAAAAIDVFNEEPYRGALIDLSNCYLTSHMGSCTEKARYDMEIGSILNIIDSL